MKIKYTKLIYLILFVSNFNDAFCSVSIDELATRSQLLDCFDESDNTRKLHMKRFYKHLQKSRHYCTSSADGRRHQFPTSSTGDLLIRPGNTDQSAFLLTEANNDILLELAKVIINDSNTAITYDRHKDNYTMELGIDASVLQEIITRNTGKAGYELVFKESSSDSDLTCGLHFQQGKPSPIKTSTIKLVYAKDAVHAWPVTMYTIRNSSSIPTSSAAAPAIGSVHAVLDDFATFPSLTSSSSAAKKPEAHSSHSSSAQILDKENESSEEDSGVKVSLSTPSLEEECLATPVKGAAVDTTNSLFSPDTVVYSPPGNMIPQQKKSTLSASAPVFSPTAYAPPIAHYHFPPQPSYVSTFLMQPGVPIYIDSKNFRKHMNITYPTTVIINMWTGDAFDSDYGMRIFNINLELLRPYFQPSMTHFTELAGIVEERYAPNGEHFLLLHG